MYKPIDHVVLSIFLPLQKHIFLLLVFLDFLPYGDSHNFSGSHPIKFPVAGGAGGGEALPPPASLRSDRERQNH